MACRYEDASRALGENVTAGSFYITIIQTAALLENAERELAKQASADRQQITVSFDVPADLTGTALEIVNQCEQVAAMLIEKNRMYGDSALNPVRVFSKCDSLEQLNVRMDDKLSRIMSAQDDDIEDSEDDLLGYMILKRVKKSRMK